MYYATDGIPCKFDSNNFWDLLFDYFLRSTSFSASPCTLEPFWVLLIQSFGRASIPSLAPIRAPTNADRPQVSPAALMDSLTAFLKSSPAPRAMNTPVLKLPGTPVNKTSQEFHENCHSVTFYFTKKDSKWCSDTTTPESIHTKDESKRGSAFAFIFGVNWPVLWMKRNDKFHGIHVLPTLSKTVFLTTWGWLFMVWGWLKMNWPLKSQSKPLGE